MGSPQFFTETSPRSITRENVPSNLARFESILTQGIQSHADIELALEYIRTVAPQFGGELLEGWRRAGRVIRIEVDPKAPHSSAQQLPISFFDRDANYERVIRLKQGADIFHVVHELIHALPQELQPKVLREIKIPTANLKSRFGEMRKAIPEALMTEESKAYGAEVIFYEEAVQRDPGIVGDIGFYEIYRTTEGSTREKIAAIREALPELAPFYVQQGKILSIMIPLAAKTANLENREYSIQNIMESLLGDEALVRDEATGILEIRPDKAAVPLYDLLNSAFEGEGMSTLEIMTEVGELAYEQDLDKILDRIAMGLEVKFDGTEFAGQGSNIITHLEGALNLGPRSEPRDVSEDRGYLREPEMAETVIRGWAAMLRYVEAERERGGMQGPDYLRFITNMAKNSEDPYAGELYGQAWMLAFAQAEKKPELLLPLANSLARAGYTEKAAEAFHQYLEFCREGNLGVFTAEKNYNGSALSRSVAAMGTYLNAVEALPQSEQRIAVSDLLSRFDYQGMVIHQMRERFTYHYGEGFQFTDIEQQELREMFSEGFASLDQERLTYFIEQVFADRSPQEFEGKVGVRPDSGFYYNDWKIFESDRVRILRADLVDTYRESALELVGVASQLSAMGALSSDASIQETLSVFGETIREVPEMQRWVMEERWGGELPEGLPQVVLERFGKAHPKTYMEDVYRSFFVFSNVDNFIRAAEAREGESVQIPYFETYIKILESIPNSPNKMESYYHFLFGRGRSDLIDRLDPEQKLRLVKSFKACVSAVADLELVDPGFWRRFSRSNYTDIRLGDWKFQAKKDHARVEAARAEDASVIPKEKIHTIYASWMLGLARKTLTSGDAALVEFGMKCLAEVASAKGDYLDWTSPEDDIHLKFSPEISEREGKVGLVQNVHVRKIQFLVGLTRYGKFDKLHHAKPEAATSILEELAGFYELYVQYDSSVEQFHRAAEEISFTPKLVYLVTAAVSVGEYEYARRFADLADQLGITEDSLPDNEKRAFHIFEHAKFCLEVQELIESGEGVEANRRATELVVQLEADLAGRVYYRADELLILAEMLDTLPGLGKQVEKVYAQAIDRYVKRYGEGRDWDDKSHVRDFVKAIHKAQSIEVAQKDHLLCKLIDGLAGLVVIDKKNAQTYFEATSAIIPYLREGRYAQSDRRLYHHGANLIQMLPLIGDQVNRRDVLSALSKLAKYYLGENPWLREPEAHLQVSSTGNWRYLRDIAEVFPGQVKLLAPVTLRDGTLNLEPAAQGFVDIDKYFDSLMNQIESGELNGEALRRAVAAGVQGSILNCSSRIQGSQEAIQSKLPVLTPLFKRVEVELTSAEGLTAVGEQCLQGLIEGLNGEALPERVLFYADLLGHKKVPLEMKRDIWSRFKRAGVVSNYLDNQMQRYVKAEGGPCTELELYDAVARMLKISGSRLPEDPLLVLYLEGPKVRKHFFAAMKRWHNLSRQADTSRLKKFPAEVNLSDIYDVLFFFSVGRKISVSNLADFQFNELLQWGVSYNAGLGKITPRVRNSYPAGIVGIVDSAQAIAEVEGQELPPFLESLPRDVRALTASLITQLVPGERSAVMAELDRMETTAGTGEKIRYLLESLGWAKVGQILSVSPLLSPEVRAELAPLQDSMPPSTRTEIVTVLQFQLGDYFQEIDSIKWPPLKSGSIGEIVEAQLKDGRKVAIKVVTAGRRRAVGEMQKQFREAVVLLKRAGITNVYGFNLERTSEHIIGMISEEMNLSLERSRYHLYGRLPEGMRRPGLIEEAPKSKSVLVMEWQDGEKLTTERVEGHWNREAFRRQLAELVGKPFEDGIFQGDPHPGNFMVSPAGQLVMLDFGQLVQINEAQMDHLLQLAIALRAEKNKSQAVAHALMAMDESPESIKSRIQSGELVRQLESILAANSGETKVSIGTFFDLMRVASDCGIAIDARYEGLFKYFATLEGSARLVDPEFNVSEALANELSSYAERRFSELGLLKLARTGRLPKSRRAVFLSAQLREAILEGNNLREPLEGILDRLRREGKGNRVSLARLGSMLASSCSSLPEERWQSARSEMIILLNEGLRKIYPDFDGERYLLSIEVIDIQYENRHIGEVGEAFNTFQEGQGDEATNRGRLRAQLGKMYKALDAYLRSTGHLEAREIYDALVRTFRALETTVGEAHRASLIEMAVAEAPEAYQGIAEEARKALEDSVVELSFGMPEYKVQERVHSIKEYLNLVLRQTTHAGPQFAELREQAGHLRVQILALEWSVIEQGSGEGICEADLTRLLADYEQFQVENRKAIAELAEAERGRFPGVVPYKMVNFSEAEMNRIAEAHNIPKEMIAEVIGLAASPDFIEQMNERVATELSPQKIEKWLETTEGKKFLAKHQDVLKNRARMGIPGLTMGIISLLAAEEVAEIIGIDPRYQPLEHFAFVVAISHMANVGTGEAMKVVMRKGMSAPFQAIAARTYVAESGEKIVELVYRDVQGIFAKGFLQAVQQQFVKDGVAKTLLKGGVKNGVAVIRFPYKMALGMGLGLLSSKVADWALPKDTPWRNTIMFLSFFAPDVARMAFGSVRNRAASLGLTAAARLFSAGFMVELGNMGYTRWVYGEDGTYENSVNQRAAERKDTEQGVNELEWSDALIIPLALKGIDHGLEIITPQSAADADSYEGFIPRKTKHWYDVREEDRKQSKALQEQLKSDLISSFITGPNPEVAEDVNFYQTFIFEASDYVAMGELEDEAFEFIQETLEDEPELKPASLYHKMKEYIQEEYPDTYAETELQNLFVRVQRRQLLDQLHFIALDINKPIREFTDEKGRISDEVGFYNYLTNDNSMGEFEESILMARKVSLGTRLLLAENENEIARLKKLAQEVGLINHQGDWLDQEVYLASRQQWAMALLNQAPDNTWFMDPLQEHADQLVRQVVDPALDPKQKQKYYEELISIGAIQKGSAMDYLFNPE